MKYILSINKTINVLLAVSIISIFLKIWVLDDIPELFKRGSELGEVYYRLCLSYIASYIFYFVVVHVKREKDKENINNFINPKIRNAYSQWKPQLKDLCNAADESVPPGLPDKAFVAKLFRKIDPNSNAPLCKGALSTNANWLEYFLYYKNRVDRFIGLVTDKMPFLDSKLVQLLSELSECEHFRFVEACGPTQVTNPNLSDWADGFHAYCVKSDALENYANEFHTLKH